jgi:hypothetical protein
MSSIDERDYNIDSMRNDYYNYYYYAMLYTHAAVTILIIIAICIYLFLIYLEEEITMSSIDERVISSSLHCS